MRNRRHRKQRSSFVRVDPNGILTDKEDVMWSCTRKQAYDTDWQAKVAADELSKQHHKPFRWYHCKYCGKFHVTSN